MATVALAFYSRSSQPKQGSQASHHLNPSLGRSTVRDAFTAFTDQVIKNEAKRCFRPSSVVLVTQATLPIESVNRDNSVHNAKAHAGLL